MSIRTPPVKNYLCKTNSHIKACIQIIRGSLAYVWKYSILECVINLHNVFIDVTTFGWLDRDGAIYLISDGHSEH